MIGERLGDYEVAEEIGRGSMATVYRAIDTSTGNTVALKVLKASLAADRALVKRFLREARDGARLDHPGIVKVHDTGEVAGTYYFAMDLLVGKSLEEILFDRGHLEPSQAAELGIEVAEALGYAHGEGILHRDIKPANILIYPDGRYALADFGIALAAADTRVTQVGETLGSPLYLSPEIFRGEEADARSDLYALGIVLFQVLTGEAPYGAGGFLAIAEQHAAGVVPRVRELDPSLPEEMDRIVARLMAKEQEDRYQTAAELADALRSLDLGEAPQLTIIREREQARSGTSAGASAARPGEQRRRSPARIAVVAVLVGLVVAIGVYLGLTVGGC